MICDPDALEELAAGRLSGPDDRARAAALEAHARACERCRRELEWLRAERELMQRRAAAAPPQQRLWRGIERRIAETPRRSALGRMALPALMAAAATFAVIWWSRWRPPLRAPSLRSAGAQVERQIAARGYDREYAASLSSVVIQLEPPP
ncbi:MAG TPA: hypothetical protein VFF06_32920 [Polyangia bacterium]|nr:hypothetical protein [Polyangia bacterium]